MSYGIQREAVILKGLEGVPITFRDRDPKKTQWPLVRERTIPTKRPPLVDEIWCGGSPTVVNLSFLDKGPSTFKLQR
jgi:hypothetical protein